MLAQLKQNVIYQKATYYLTINKLRILDIFVF